MEANRNDRDLNGESSAYNVGSISFADSNLLLILPGYVSDIVSFGVFTLVFMIY